LRTPIAKSWPIVHPVRMQGSSAGDSRETLQTPVLTDGDVVLRVATERDADAMTAGLADFETARWLISVPHPYPHEDSLAWICEVVPTGWQSGKQLWFVVADATTDQFLGEIGLRDVDRSAAMAEVGYWLAPAARGRGAARRALQLLVAWSFDDLGIERLDWAAMADNWASRAVAEAVGFRFEGVRRSRAFRISDATRHDECVMGLVRGDLSL